MRYYEIRVVHKYYGESMLARSEMYTFEEALVFCIKENKKLGFDIDTSGMIDFSSSPSIIFYNFEEVS